MNTEIGTHRSNLLDWQKPSPVLVVSCVILLFLITGTASQPELTSNLLSRAGDFYLAKFPHWIVWSVSIYLTFCLLIAVVPCTGKRKLGKEEDRSGYSFFSWFSMIFGVGMAVGLLTWGVAEPLAGMENNPDVIRGLSVAGTSENTSSALKWSYAHWGFAGWAAYALIGLAIAYTGHRQQLPLTMRTALTPLFGNATKGWLGHLVDVLTVVAAFLGIVQVLGYALDETVLALAQNTNIPWLLNEEGNAGVFAKIATSTFVLFFAALSAISGITRGVKWSSNINMGLSLVVLVLILLASSVKEGLLTLFLSLSDYLINLPSMMFSVWSSDGTEIGDGLRAWQGTWSMYHWAGWWLGFAPFIGIFLARVSKGRSVRQYLFASIVLPALLTIVWMSWVGGSAIDLELNGEAKGTLINASVGLKLFTQIQLLFDGGSAWLVAMVLIVLVISNLTTMIDSAMIETSSVLRGAKDTAINKVSILVWFSILSIAMAFLIMLDGLSSIRSSMVLASAPISVLIVLLGVSLCCLAGNYWASVVELLLSRKFC